jgi:hypothetical protein
MKLPRIAVGLAFAAIAVAEQRPNFSGTWTLNLAESDFTDKHASPPDSAVMTVQQHGDEVKYRFEREKKGKKGDMRVEVIAGVADQPGGDGTASAVWKADELVFKLIYNAGQETQFDAIDTWSLSPDGKKLTSDLVTHLPKNGGESHVRRVFDKKN